MLNKSGKIVSKKMAAAAKVANRLAPYKSNQFKKRGAKQAGGGTLGDVSTGLMAAGGLAGLTGVGAEATPFLEAAGGLAKGADWVANILMLCVIK